MGENSIPKSVVFHVYWNLAWRYDVIPSIWRKKDGTKFAHNILDKKFWKIIAVDDNQHIILTMYTNTRFESTGSASDFETKFVQNYMNDKTFGQKKYDWYKIWKNKH